MGFFKRLLGVFAWALFPLISLGQTNSYTLYGTVEDARTGDALPGATVYIAELERGSHTSATGVFALEELTPGKFSVRFSFIGYETLDTTLVIDADTKLNVRLEPFTYQEDELVVVAGRDSLMESNRFVSVIEKAELDQQRGQTLGEALSSAPGVTLLKTGPSITKPVIRGLHSQRVVMHNHGISQEGQQWGGEHAPEIDPFAPDRIEIIKGAAGVEYGLGAIGGIVRVDEAPINKQKGIHGAAYLNAFSNNMQAATSLQLSSGVKSVDGLGWRLKGSLRQAGDSRTPNDVIGNSAFRESSYSAQLNYEHGRLDHDLYYSHFGTELGIYRGAHIGNFTDLMRAIERGRPLVDYDFSYDIEAPKQQISHDLIRYEGKYQLPDNARIELTYGFQDNHRQEFDAHKRFSDDPAALEKPAFDLTLYSHTADVKYRHRPIAGFTGSIGISGKAQTNVRKGSGFLIPNFRAYGGGIYWIENWSNGKLSLETGLRYDYQWRRIFAVESKNIDRGDYTYNRLTFVGGFSYQLGDTWSLSGNAGSAWRPPGVNEQFSNGVHHGTAQFEKGNPALQPEKSYTLDLTLRKVSPRFYGQLGGFTNLINDYIFLEPGVEPVVTIRGSFPYFEYKSTNALLYGLDGVLQYQLSDAMRMSSTISIVRGKNRTANEPLIYMPADQLQFSSRYALPVSGNFSESFIEGSAKLVREQHQYPNNLDYAPPPEGYALFNLMAGTTVQLGGQRIEVSAALNNVFNNTYRDYLSRFRYFIDEPGRNLIIKARLEF